MSPLHCLLLSASFCGCLLGLSNDISQASVHGPNFVAACIHRIALPSLCSCAGSLARAYLHSLVSVNSHCNTAWRALHIVRCSITLTLSKNKRNTFYLFAEAKQRTHYGCSITLKAECIQPDIDCISMAVKHLHRRACAGMRRDCSFNKAS